MQVPEILKRAAKSGEFERVRYIDKNTPTSMSNITVMPFFGDIRSTCVLSSLLLRRYREESKGSKYFILCSWPGYENLFPYVDEYWSVKPEIVKSMMYNANGFFNESPSAVECRRKLNHFFEEVIDFSVMSQYYDQGIQQEYFDRFKNIKRFLPTLPSANILGNEFNRELGRRHGNKVFVYPISFIHSWKNGRLSTIKIFEDFWISFLERLLEEGFVPVVYQNYLTFDVSSKLLDKCIYVTDNNIVNVLGAMRATGCVVDIFSGISRLAILARCPFVACDERGRFSGLKEYEIDDLCGQQVPRKYIFSFSTIIESGNKHSWEVNLFDGVIAKLNSLFPSLDREKWPSTSESNEIVPYSVVRRNKSKRFGTKFIKVTRD